MQFKLKAKIDFSLFFLAATLCVCSCTEKEVLTENSSAKISYIFDDQLKTVTEAKPVQNGASIYVGQSGHDGLIMLINSNRRIEWKKVLGGELGDAFEQVIQTSDGGYLAVGYTNSESLGAISGNRDGWVVKVTATGEIEWQKTIGGNFVEYFTHVAEMKDGNFILTGLISPQSRSTWVVKISSVGSVLWNKSFEIGPWHDIGKAIGVTPNGNIKVVGLASKTSGGVGLGQFKSYYLELDPTYGSKRNEYYFDQFVREESSDEETIALKVIYQDDGLVWATTIEQADFKYYIQLVKTAYDGTMLFEKKLYGLGMASLQSIARSDAGGFIITGGTKEISGISGELRVNAKSMVIKTDANGEVLWTSAVGDNSSIQVALYAAQVDIGWQVGAASSSIDGIKLMTYFLDDSGQLITR